MLCCPCSAVWDSLSEYLYWHGVGRAAQQTTKAVPAAHADLADPELQADISARRDYGKPDPYMHDDHQHPSYDPPYYQDAGRERPYDREDGLGDSYHDQDWPECWGQCYAGACKLEQSHPGCCYLSTHATYQRSTTDRLQEPQGPGNVEALAQQDTYRHDGRGSKGMLHCWPESNASPRGGAHRL